MRHAFCASWLQLLKVLLQHVTPAELDVLSSNPIVRKEWRTEPISWLYGMLVTPWNVANIVAEVREGLWRMHPVEYGSD